VRLPMLVIRVYVPKNTTSVKLIYLYSNVYIPEGFPRFAFALQYDPMGCFEVAMTGLGQDIILAVETLPPFLLSSSVQTVYETEYTFLSLTITIRTQKSIDIQ